MTKPKATGRRTTVKPDVIGRSVRDEPLVTEIPTDEELPISEAPPPKLAASIPHEQLGTIPRGYTYSDAIAVIDTVGLEVWRRWGNSKRLDALRLARRE